MHTYSHVHQNINLSPLWEYYFVERVSATYNLLRIHTFWYIFIVHKKFLDLFLCVPLFGICGGDVLGELHNILGWMGQFS